MKVVVLKTNWADEFDIEAIRVFTDEEWEEFEAGCQRASYPCEAYFGTNECVEIDSAEEYLSWLTVHNWPGSDSSRLEELLGKSACKFGFGLWVEPEILEADDAEFLDEEG